MRRGDPGAASGGARPRWQALNTFASLRHPNFRLLWITSLLNAGSNWIQQVTLGWLAYDLTGSALTAGLVFGVRSLPALFVGPIGGVLGDRFERKRGLQINSGYMAVLALIFALHLALGNVQAWHIVLFTFLQGLGQALVMPVRQALVANTVPREDLMNAIALNSLAFNAMRVVGPAVAGALIVIFGPALNFGIQSLAYVAVFLLVLPLKSPHSEMDKRRANVSFRESFLGGLTYVRQNPTTRGLILLALIPALFTTPINLGLLPVYASDVLKVGSGGLGMMYSVQGLGAVIGTLTIASLGNFRSKGLLLSAGALCLAGTITIYSQITVFLVALPFLALATGSLMTYTTLTMTIIQTTTPDEYRGRVSGLNFMVHGFTPFGSLLFGAIAEFYGASTAMLIAGVCALSFMLLILASFPSIRAFRSDPNPPPAPAEPPTPGKEEGATAVGSTMEGSGRR